jgi:hypothetical protein
LFHDSEINIRENLLDAYVNGLCNSSMSENTDEVKPEARHRDRVAK